MSRHYAMEVTVVEFAQVRKDQIKAAAQELWNFHWFCDADTELVGDGESWLTGGESDYGFACRLAKAIWLANGGFCRVAVNATYLESLPYESYELTEAEFARLTTEEVQPEAATDSPR